MDVLQRNLKVVDDLGNQRAHHTFILLSLFLGFDEFGIDPLGKFTDGCFFEIEVGLS